MNMMISYQELVRTFLKRLSIKSNIMANKAKCFEFIYYVVINKMADDVNLITCITGGDGTIDPV